MKPSAVRPLCHAIAFACTALMAGPTLADDFKGWDERYHRVDHSAFCGAKSFFVGKVGPGGGVFCAASSTVPAMVTNGWVLAPGEQERLAASPCAKDEYRVRMAGTPYACMTAQSFKPSDGYEVAPQDKERHAQDLTNAPTTVVATAPTGWPIYRMDGKFSGLWSDFQLCKPDAVHITKAGANLDDHDCIPRSMMPSLQAVPGAK